LNTRRRVIFANRVLAVSGRRVVFRHPGIKQVWGDDTSRKFAQTVHLRMAQCQYCAALPSSLMRRRSRTRVCCRRAIHAGVFKSAPIHTFTVHLSLDQQIICTKHCHSHASRHVHSILSLICSVLTPHCYQGVRLAAKRPGFDSRSLDIRD
jgi:hypothetical protein